MPAGQLAVRYAPDTVFIRLYTAIVGVGRKRVTAVTNKGQGPRPFLVRQFAISPGCTDLLKQGLRIETAAQRNGDEVLYQYIQWLGRRAAGFDSPGGHGFLGRCRLDQFQAMCRHQRDAGGTSRGMAASPGALQQTCNAFGRAHL